MLTDDLKNKKINISLRILDPNDLAIGWEVKAIVENPDIFENFFSKYSLMQVESFDDFYLYLLTLKLQSLSAVVPLLLQDDHKTKVSLLSQAADAELQAVSPGSIIKFINGHIEEIFKADISKHDIRLVTINLIAKYNTGISKETFLYLCKQYGYLLIDQFDSFEIVFEREPDLFQALFPTGKLEEINPFRLEKVLNIWQHIVSKGKSKLKDIVSACITVLYADVVSLAESATIDNVMQVEGTIREFNSFLQRIQSPLANEFAQNAKNTENLLSEYLTERGHAFKYDIPVAEIVKRWKATANWELRLLYTTHDPVEVDGQPILVSRLAKEPERNVSLIDMVSTNVPTDDYYTFSYQQRLSIYANVGTGTIAGIIFEQETAEDFFLLLSSAIQFISDEMHVECDELNHDIAQLISMVQLVANNRDLDENTVHSLCYGAAMFICAFSEKLLRLFYLDLIKDIRYVPINKATMGELLSESNSEMLNAFGFHHIKSISFFLLQTPQKSIGHNIRNMLAHWSNISANTLKPVFVATVLWLFTDILNTVFWHYLKEKSEEDKRNDQL